MITNPWMNRIGEMSLQIVLWTAVGLILLLLLRTASPLARKRLLLLTCAGIIVLTALAMIAPLWRVGALISQWQPQSSITAPEANITVTVQPTGDAGRLAGWLKNLFVSQTTTQTLPLNEEAGSASVDWLFLLPYVILACSGFFLLQFVIGVGMLRRYFRDSDPVENDRLATVLNDLRRSMGIARPVAVRESAILAGPATLGWRRSLILLPDTWRTWTDDELRSVLAHELAHVGSSDFLTNAFVQFARALHGYNPLVHLIARNVQNQLELLADARAAEHVGQKCYLRSICQLALRPSPRKVRPPALAFLSSLPLSRRMMMLKDTCSTRHHSPRALAWLATAVLLASLVAIAGLRSPVAADEPPDRNATKATMASPATEQPLPFKLDDFDLRFIPADAAGVIALRPALACTLPWFKAQVPAIDQIFHEMLGYPLPIFHAPLVDQVVCGLRFTPKTKDQRGNLLTTLALVRLREGHTFEPVFLVALRDVKPIRHAGKAIYPVPDKITQGRAPGVHLGVLDSRTLLIGNEESVKAALEGSLVSRKSPAADWAAFQRSWAVFGFDLALLRKHILQSNDTVQADLLKPYAAVWKEGDHLLGGLMPESKVAMNLLISKSGQPIQVDASLRGALEKACRDLLLVSWKASEKEIPVGEALGKFIQPSPAQLVFQMKPIITYEALFGNMINTSPSRPVQFQSNILICDVTKDLLKELQDEFRTKRVDSSQAKRLREMLKSHSGATMLATPSLIAQDNEKASVSLGPNKLQMTVLHQLNLSSKTFNTTVGLESPEGSQGCTVECSLEDEESVLLHFGQHKNGEKYRLVVATVRCIR